MVPVILDNLTDDELKKEAKNESKNDAISAIIKAAKCLVSRVPNQEEMVKSLEIFRLKMILRYEYQLFLSQFELESLKYHAEGLLVHMPSWRVLEIVCNVV